ncbi:hypothetical protein MMC25_000830 [Agyrium rufum]|nr:hypothetical protein [Agyrium rufum]
MDSRKQAASAPGNTNRDAEFMMHVLLNMEEAGRPKTDWNKVATAMGLKSGGVAATRYGQIKKKLAAQFGITLPTSSPSKVPPTTPAKNGTQNGEHEAATPVKNPSAPRNKRKSAADAAQDGEVVAEKPKAKRSKKTEEIPTDMMTLSQIPFGEDNGLELDDDHDINSQIKPEAGDFEYDYGSA